MYTNLIFDLDGTLVDSSADIIDSLKSAFAKAGLAVPVIEEIQIGLTLKHVLEKVSPGISQSEFESVTKNFRSFYDNSSYPRTRLYDGTFDVLNKLKAKGCELFIATNKPKYPASRILFQLGIDVFSDIATSDYRPGQIFSKAQMIDELCASWSLDRSKTVMIGDTPSDIIAAKDTGVKSIAVTYGYSHKTDLASAKPDYIVGSMNELFKLFS